MNSMMIDPAKMNELAFNYDPSPILASLQGAGDNQWSVPGAEQSLGQKNPYATMLNPGEQSTTPPGMNPLDPKSAMMLNSLIPQPPKPQFAPGATPHPGTPVTIHIPDISHLVNVHLGAGARQAPSSLSQILGK